MKKLGAVISLAICFVMVACSRGSKKEIERIVYQNEDTTSEQPPLTPELLEDAEKAFLSAYANDGNFWNKMFGGYSRVKHIREQGKSGLCRAFALRDLLVNNLGLDEQNAPSVYSLLALNNYDSNKILISTELSYNLDDFKFLSLASNGGELITENSEPFDEGLFEAYSSIKSGAGYKSELLSLSSEKPKIISLKDFIDNQEKSVEGLLIERPKSNRKIETVKIPKFTYRNSIVNTRTLIEEMKILGQRLADGKAQVMSVCGYYIKGFSKKLVPKNIENAESMNNENLSNGCGRHAVLVTGMTANEHGEPLIVFKNSWGNALSDDGFHALPVKRFMMILGTWSDEKNDTRLASFRTEFEKVSDDTSPVHQIDTSGGWRIESQVKDSVYPKDLVLITHRWKNIKIACFAKGSDPAACKGTFSWKGQKNPRNHYLYEGDLKITNLMPNYFDEVYEEGVGRLSLWGNVIKEGVFKGGVLRKGIYREFFSEGRSPNISLVEEGDYDSNEVLVKGTRKTFNRAGELLKSESVGI